jgi:hypothetical protein
VGEKPNIWRKISQIAGGQWGNVTRRQLLALGAGRSQIDYWVGNGRLHRVHSGVYAVGRPPAAPLERAAAAVLACGPRCALSHGSAMALWGLWKRWELPLHVTVGGDRRPPGVVTHRSARLLRRDIRTRQGIRVTSPARTLLDCAPAMGGKSLRRRINEARRTGTLNLEALADVVERFPLHPGAPLLRPFVGESQAPTRSGFEDDFLEFCRRYGLPTPLVNTVVAGHEVDALFVEERVIVELDSWGWHWSRASFEDDRNRDADTLLADLVTIRITDQRFERRPDEEAARLHAILARRRGLRA